MGSGDEECLSPALAIGPVAEGRQLSHDAQGRGDDAQWPPSGPQGFQLTGIHGDVPEAQRTTEKVQQPVRL